MVRRMRRLAPLILLCSVSLLGCPKRADPSKDAGIDPPIALACNGECTADEKCNLSLNQCELALADRCTAGSTWAPGTKAFENQSAAWGLSGAIAGGTRISSADLDGDGRVDLIVRRAGNHRDDPAGQRAVWVMRNTENGFEDVTVSSGLLQNRDGTTALGRPAEIVVFADVDNDGDLDAYTGASATTSETSEVLLNDGAGKFTLAPEANEIRKVGDALGGASFVDANRDGRIDLFTGGASATQDRLYIGLGDGTFAEVTEAAGMKTLEWINIADLNAGLAHTSSWGVAACDLNADGYTDLLSSSYGRAPNHLWVGSGVNGNIPTFENRSVESGYAFDQRIDWTDNESARCFCKLNPTAPDCAGVPAPAYIQCNVPGDVFRWNHANDREPFRLGGNSGTTVCGDVDADGDLDLLTTEIVHWDVGSSSDPSELLINQGHPLVRFARPGNETMGLTRPQNVPFDNGDITGALFDFDNDGRLDVYIGSTDYDGTRAWLYHQKTDGTFQSVPLTDGIDHTSSHGVAVADFDLDGDLDLVLGHSRARCQNATHCYPETHARFFENKAGQGGNWLQLELEGAEGTNRAAIGARVTVAAGNRTQALEVGGGHGHYGIQHSLVQHAGLGAACEAEVTVRWPDAAGTTQTFKLPANYRYRLKQGGRPVVLP